MTYLGLAIVFGGVALRAWAIRTISHTYGLRGKNLVRYLAATYPPSGYTSLGPYRYFGHPMYLGSLMVIFGVGLVAFHTLLGAFAITLPSVPYFLQRMTLEERGT